MKSLTESPAILTVHAGSPGQYILRTTDLRHRPLVVAVTKLLADASSFVVITPSDIKVFTAEPQEETHVPEIDAETKSAIDAEEVRSVPGTDIPAEMDDEGSTEEPVPAKPRRRAKPASVAGHDEKCGRCSGAGRIAIALDNGVASDAACPICKGTGVMVRYGARR